MGMNVFASAINFDVITKSDATLITCNALYVGTGGDVALSQSDSATPVVFSNVPDGAYLNVKLKEGRVMSTATTASDIVRLDW